MIGASSACLTVSFVSLTVGSLRSFALTLRDPGLLLDDLFLRTVSWDLRVLVVTVGLCLSSHLPQLRARSHASRRINLPLLESV